MNSFFYWFCSFFLIFIFPFNLHLTLIFFKSNYFQSIIEVIFFLFGITLSLIMIKFTKIPKLIYIFFHECSHAFFVLFYSGKVKKFKVTKNFGYIKTSKTNTVIRLAPYLFPMSPFLILVLYYITLIYSYYHKVEIHIYYHYCFYFSFSFLHYLTTHYNVKLLFLESSDLEKGKTTLSLLLIINCYYFLSLLLFYTLFNKKAILKYIYFL